jgi:antitoxin YefM
MDVTKNITKPAKSGTIKGTIRIITLMEIHNASQARANLFKLLEQINQEKKPCMITSRKGDGVLISKADWESIQETLYLQSIPGFIKSVRQAEADDKWVSEAEFIDALNGLDD